MCRALPLLTQHQESVVLSDFVNRSTNEQPRQQFYKRLLTNNDIKNNDSRSTSSSRKRRRVVQFSMTQQEIKLSSSSFYITDEEVQSCGWYNKTELDEMRFEARDICRQIRNEDMVSSSNCSNDISCFDSLPSMNNNNDVTQLKQKLQPLLSLNEETRGLEHRICFERQRRKYLVRQFVLTAASKLKLNQPKHVNKLAWASSKVTRYSTKLAIEEALRDYIRAYQQN